MMMSITERAMLVSLHTGIWSATKADKEVSERARQAHNAERTAGNFNKLLIARSSMKNVSSVASRARTLHGTLTLPWGDNGQRILKSDTYDEYSREMRTFRKQFEVAADAFAKDFPNFMKQAKQFLGAMWDKEDYPDPDTVRSKFHFYTAVDPLPDSSDFRVKLGDKQVKSIVKEIELRNKERLDRAMADVYARISDVTERMAEKLENYSPSPGAYLGDTSGVFRETLVSNVKEIADLIPAINITNDENLEKLRIRMINELCAHDAETLRKDTTIRNKTAKQAADIAKKVSKFLA